MPVDSNVTNQCASLDKLAMQQFQHKQLQDGRARNRYIFGL
jgi:hypothetical protein